MGSSVPTTVLLLPGWQDSDADHWQTRWETIYQDKRVQQHDWLRPLRGDWCARLEEEVVAARHSVALVAHSLGCLLVAAWAAHSRHASRVRAALLVAPPDIERDDLRQMIPGWSPPVRKPLPFRALVVASSNDPYCGADRSRGMASDWDAGYFDAGAAGHLNAESGLRDWLAGRAQLNELLKQE